jgi:hypothetical protein
MRRQSMAFIFFWLFIAFFCSPLNAMQNDIKEAINLLQQGEYVEAIKLLKKPAYKNNPDANYLLGVAHSNGDGVKEDISLAINFFERAVASNNNGSSPSQSVIDAMHSLGGIYYQDPRVNRDYPKAYSWYLSAAKFGDAGALGAIASMHLLGNIFPPNPSDGVRFAMLATNRGWEYDKDFFEYISKDFSPKKIQQLQEQLKDCAKPFHEKCLVSKGLDLKTAFVRTSDLVFWKYDKGFFLDTSEIAPLDGLYNHFSREKLDMPTLFSAKKVILYPGAGKPDVCQVYGDDMNLVWYSNAGMPEGKGLEFHRKDYIQFECKTLNLEQIF